MPTKVKAKKREPVKKPKDLKEHTKSLKEAYSMPESKPSAKKKAVKKKVKK